MVHNMMAAAAASPANSEVFSGAALLTVSLMVVLILRHYLPLRTTAAYLLVPVFFALLLPASMVLLVPIDLASSAMVDDVSARGVWLEPGALRVAWRIIYWLTFALTWFLLPILGEYSYSGYHEPKDKILDSLRANAQYYAIVFGSALAVLLYILWSYGQFSESLKSTAMALAYCWGLVLAIYLMGHGLVAIPRRLFRNASVSGRLRRIQSQAPRVYEQMEDAEMRLEDLEDHVSGLTRKASAGAGNASQFRDWIEDLADMTNLPESQLSSLSFSSRRQRGAVRGTRDVEDGVMPTPTVVTEKYLADLTRHLLQARHARARYVDEWSRLLTDAVELQAILDSAASKRLDFGRATPQAGFWGRVAILNPYTRYLLHFRVIPVVRIVLGSLLAIASVCIVWSELVKGFLPTLSVIRYSVVHYWVRVPAPGSRPGEPGHHGDDMHPGHGRSGTMHNNSIMHGSDLGAQTIAEMKGQIGFAGQFIAALWMCYMSAAALVSITEVKVWRGRALVRRNTTPESAFWYASQVARLSVPLTYNFMTFLGTSIYRDTVFYAFLGQLINLTPLGGWFDLLFPAFIMLPVCATLFGLYGKVGRAIGLERVDIIDDEDEDGEGTGGQVTGARHYGLGAWREGRALIERELNGSSAAIRRTRAAASTLPSAGGLGAGGRAAPILTIPQPSNPSSSHGNTTPRYGGPTTPLGTSPGARPVANTSARRAAATSRPRRGGMFAGGDDDDGDDNFFESLGHRVRNTIDTIEPPRWLQDIGQNIKKLSGGGNGREGRIRL